MRLHPAGLFLLALGIVCVVLWRPFGRSAYAFQSRHGWTRTPVPVYQWGYLLVGIFSCLMGICALMGWVSLGD